MDLKSLKHGINDALIRRQSDKFELIWEFHADKAMIKGNNRWEVFSDMSGGIFAPQNYYA